MPRQQNHEGRYFVMRKGYGDLPGPDDIGLLADWVFFNHWSRRLNPYKSLQEGDTLYLLDHERRALAVELRVNYLVKSSYETLIEGMDQLRAVYGVAEPDGGWPGYSPASGPGYLLGYGLDVIGSIDIPFDFRWDILGGRHGYISVDTFASSTKIDQTTRDDVLEQLPEPGRRPMARATAADTKAVADETILSRAPRRPSTAVMAQVRAESGGVCEAQGCKRKAEHFDHVVPWSKGGNSDYENIEHLCSTCNLKKSDRVPEEHYPDQLWFRFKCSDDLPSEVDFEAGDRALEVRTANSVYFAVMTEREMLAWKRGSRTLWCSSIVDEDLWIDRSDGSRQFRVPGHLPYTSPVVEVVDREAGELLDLIGYGEGLFVSPIDQPVSSA